MWEKAAEPKQPLGPLAAAYAAGGVAGVVSFASTLAATQVRKRGGGKERGKE